MSRLFYHVMQDNLGNLLFDVTGTMRLAGTGTAANIYGDAALTIPLPNPMTNHPSFGSFKCYLGAGNYDFYMAKSGYSFETLTGVQGWGTMALQDHTAVTIAGGNATLTGIGLGGYGHDPTFAINAQGNSTLNGRIGVGMQPVVGYQEAISFTRVAGNSAMMVRPGDGDTGSGAPLVVLNFAGGYIGGINSTGAAVSFATSSDARLKQAIEPLTHALDVVRALNPVRFRWKSDDSPGQGLLAQEVEPLVPTAVSGTEDGVLPMGIDYSKLVPYLIGAVKELTQQVEMLTAKLGAARA